MSPHLVLVGGGHAHMVTLANLHRFIEKGHRVTVIAPSPYHYYSGMAPGMLAQTYRPEDIRFATKHVVEKQGGCFVPGKAVRIDPAEKRVCLESGETVPYDVLSLNTGSYVPRSGIIGTGQDIFPVKPVETLLDAQKRLLELMLAKRIRIGIVGGGPAAAEIAGNVWRLASDHSPDMPQIRIFAGKRFMSRFPGKVRKKVMRSLTNRGIEILGNGYVQAVRTGKIFLESGQAHDSDITILATGVRPSPISSASGLPVGPDGGLRVNRYLQSVAWPEIFGGGDCIHFDERPLEKVGVYAVRQNPVLYHNLMAALEKRSLIPFDPGRGFLLIFNMGDRTGVLKKNRVILGGRLAFMIKDHIDRRFMRRFQAAE